MKIINVITGFQRGADRFADHVVAAFRGGAAGAALGMACSPAVGAADPLPGSRELTATGDFSVQMVEGVSRFLDEQLAAAVENRASFWDPDFSSPAAYEDSLGANRQRLARMVGTIDPRVSETSTKAEATRS